jgi:hypothetical protein
LFFAPGAQQFDLHAQFADPAVGLIKPQLRRIARLAGLQRLLQTVQPALTPFLQSRHGHGGVAAERIERLAVADAARKEALRRSLEHSVYGALPFAPELSAGTRRMMPQATPLDELVADSRRERARAVAAAAAEQELLSSCTFQPDTTLSTASGPAPTAAQRRRSVERMGVPPCAMFAQNPDAAAAKFKSTLRVRLRYHYCLAARQRTHDEMPAIALGRSASCALSVSGRRARLLSWRRAPFGPSPTRAARASSRRAPSRCAA